MTHGVVLSYDIPSPSPNHFKVRILRGAQTDPLMECIDYETTLHRKYQQAIRKAIRLAGKYRAHNVDLVREHDSEGIS